MKRILLGLLLILAGVHGFAQSKGTLNTAPIQVSLITPIGTNGTNSINTVNKVSFNILAGYHAGLEGAEFGAIANSNRDYMSGFQFAGISNYTGGEVRGAQFAGITNVNLGYVGAFQFAGVSNVNTGNVSAFQFAGVCNVTRGQSNAFQFAGVTNVNLKSSEIFQGAGVVNFTLGNSKLIQAAGVANYGDTITGAQISGLTNFALNSINGAQVAGVVNAAKHVKGAQIAGVLNVAQNVEGVQVAFLNIADTIKNGVPIGFISFVRNGFHEFELGLSDGLNTYGSLKLGVPAFYNIFSVGVQYLSDNFRWGVGYGIGTHLTNNENYKVNLELLSYQINEGSSWTDAYNGLQQVKVTFSGGKNKHVKYFAGPNLNLLVSDYVEENGKIGSEFPLYTIADKMSGNTNLKFWFGLNAGIRFH